MRPVRSDPLAFPEIPTLVGRITVTADLPRMWLPTVYMNFAVPIDRKVRHQPINYLILLVIPTGIEPVTYRLGICRSILLSYGTTRPDT